MKLIGLDVGERRIGVAFGDTLLRVATPVTVIARSRSTDEAAAITALVREYDAELVVVGLPHNMDGTAGPQAEATMDFVRRVALELAVPIKLWDERLTTVEAAQRRQQRSDSKPGGKSSRRIKKSRATLDALAAAVILQDYMDDRNRGDDSTSSRAPDSRQAGE